GITASGLSLVPGGVELEVVGGSRLLFDGAVHSFPPAPAAPPTYGAPLLEAGAGSPQGARHTLAPASLAHAMVAGAPIPGGRIVVVRDRGLRVLAAATGRRIGDVDLHGVDEAFARCDPAWVGGELLLACVHAEGAHVIVFGASLDEPRLEATFPDGSAGV